MKILIDATAIPADRGGVGRYVVDAINNRDYQVVQNVILIFAFVFLIVNLIVDVGYAFLNPRIRYA